MNYATYGVKYDPSVIAVYAQALYDRAASIIFWHVVVGIIYGGAAGSLASLAFGQGLLALLAAVGGVLGGIIGASIGSSKALVLRLQAQLALCQVEIERGVREQRELALH